MKKKVETKSEIDAQIAAEWRTTTRTVARWRSEKAPVDDPAAMRRWLSTRKNIPRGTAEKLADEAIRERQLVSAETLRAIDETPEESIGAVTALKTLGREVAYWSAESERAKKRGDLVQQKFAGQQLREYARELLRYETAIEESRRTTGALVTRKKVEEILFFIGDALKVALPSFVTNVTPELVGLGEFEIGAKISAAAKDWGNVVVNSVCGLVEMPDWAIAALTSGNDFIGTPWTPDRREQAKFVIAEMMAMQSDATNAGLELIARARHEHCEKEWTEFQREQTRKRDADKRARLEWCRKRAAEGQPVPDATDFELKLINGLKKQ